MLKLRFCWARTLHPLGGTLLQSRGMLPGKGTAGRQRLSVARRGREVQKDVARNGLGAVEAELQHSCFAERDLYGIENLREV